MHEVGRLLKSILSKKGHKLFLFFLLFCMIFSFFCTPVLAEDSGGGRKQVLFINSYGYDFETVPVVMKEVSDSLGDVASIQYLFMNEKYISDEEASAHLSAELDVMTSEFKYSAVILGDDAAFDFAIQNRDKYFRNTPLIYEDINSIEKAEKYKGDALISGVVEAFPMKETIQLAATVQKDAARVVVITDNSVSGSGSAQQAMAQQKEFPNLKFELFDTSSMSADEIRRNIAAYGKDTILLYTVFNVDGSGSRYTLAQGIKLITDAAKVPVFKADEAGLGDGLIGGYMLSYQSIGQQTADLVRNALNGIKPGNENYRVGSCVYEFDWKVMEKYGISKADLPGSAVYINTSPTFFEQYETVIIPAVCCAAVIFAIILILSESKKRKLRRKLELEEKSNQAKTEFISKMSHDIRTPLNAILGMDKLAYEEAENPDKVHEYLKKAMHSGELLTSLVNDILDTTKIESGMMKLKLTPYRLKDFFGSVRNVFSGICTEKGIQFTVTENAGDAAVLTDHVRLNQLFYNLLTNAVKFTDPGGKIAFRLDCQREDSILHCDYSVSDTGCGMSQEFQKHMFDQFAQEGRGNAQGSGLGLSIVKSITNLMGGKITAESTPGIGSTFHIFLDMPIVEDGSEKAVLHESEMDLSKLKGKRLLLAEDNEINAQIVLLMLGKIGILTDVAKDGNMVVDMFKKAPSGYYSLILMDNRMPGKTGTEAAREIRQLHIPGADRIPIIALTADAFEDDYQKFIESGMNECLTKPLDQKKMLAVMLKYCI